MEKYKYKIIERKLTNFALGEIHFHNGNSSVV